MEKFRELSFEESQLVEGGYLFSTSWTTSFWRGAGIGIGVGATGAAAYYAMSC